jgi:hypothetical protein
MLRNRRNCDSISAELAFFLVANDVRFPHFHCLLAELLQSQHLLVVQHSLVLQDLLVWQVSKVQRKHLHLLLAQIGTLVSQIGTWMNSVFKAIYQIGTLVAQIVTYVYRSGTLVRQMITCIAQIGTWEVLMGPKERLLLLELPRIVELDICVQIVG